MVGDRHLLFTVQDDGPHLFTLRVFTKQPLCVRYGVRHWGRKNKQHITASSLMELNSTGRVRQEASCLWR